MSSESLNPVLENRQLHIHPVSSKVFRNQHTPTSSSSSTDTKGDEVSPRSGIPPDFVIFSVLCMYDFTPEEPDLLPFKRNEILDIIKRDDTGWWAAMRQEGRTVGWIPQAFVNALTDDMTEKLRNVRPEFRIYEYEAEQLYNTAPVSKIPIFDIDSAKPSPVSSEFQVFNPLNANNYKDRSSLHTKRPSDNNIVPKESLRTRPRPPPSPSSPMPFPPSKSSMETMSSSSWPAAQDTDRKKTRAGGLSGASIRRPVVANDTLLPLGVSAIDSKTKMAMDKVASPRLVTSFDGISKRLREENLSRRKASEDVRQNGKPRYLQPQFADQLDKDDKGNIRTGTIPALIERLTTKVGEDKIKLAEIRTFTNVFLMTFRTFMTATQLFELLVDRFDIKPILPLAEADYKDWKANFRMPLQKRILEVFDVWLEENRLLEEEPHIAKCLSDFLISLNDTPHNIMAGAMLKTVERLTFTIPSRISSTTTTSSKKVRKSRAHKNDLLKLDPVDIAEQLALLEHSLYVRISPQECLAYAKTQSGNAVHRLQEFCSTHDKLGSWVKSSILNNNVITKRADTVDFWIRVAEKCRSQNNISSMSAVIIALSSTVISRLHLTWAYVSRQSSLEALLRYNEPTGGFAGYRNLMHQAEGPCVPFITMYLTDIIHVKEQFQSEKDSEGWICFYQRARWYEIITNILKFQPRSYTIATSESTMAFIDVHLREGIMLDQNWFWSKSQEVQHSEIAHADIRKGLEAAGF